jgi:hypothetical protein
MHETFQVDLTKPEYVVGLDTLFGELAKRDGNRNRMHYQRLAAVVVLLTATNWFFPEAMAGLLFIILGFALFDGIMGRFWFKSAHGASYDPEVGVQHVEITDEGITDRSPMRERRWPWDAVRRVHDRQTALVFEFVGWDMLVLPYRLWKSDEDRRAFIHAISGRITPSAGEPISTTASPGPIQLDLYKFAAFGAFLDACLIVTFLLPPLRGEITALAQQIGRSGAILVAILISAALGYVAYRITKAWLPRLHNRSPAAATVLAHFLIWAFLVWLAVSQAGLI